MRNIKIISIPHKAKEYSARRQFVADVDSVYPKYLCMKSFHEASKKVQNTNLLFALEGMEASDVCLSAKNSNEI